MLLNNEWINEEIKEEIKKYIETNDQMQQSTTCGTQQELF